MKHFANNERESYRNEQNSIIDERTQFEIYYPPFEAAIKAGVGATMCGQNKVNGVYACANFDLLTRQLRDVLGFDGFVMSDWGAIHGRPHEYLPAGCDQEQNFARHYSVDDLREDLRRDQVDQSVYRITKKFIENGLYDDPP